MYRVPKSCPIHPVATKHIKNGHPWILKDSFTQEFPERDWIIVGLNRKRPLALLMNDPFHERIKARVWAVKGDFTKQFNNFKKDLDQRLMQSVQKRINQKIIEKRENFYLVFGEADKLPGLYIQYLNKNILIQYQTKFWERYEKQILKIVSSMIFKNWHFDLDPGQIWVQDRSDPLQKLPPKCQDFNTTQKSFIVSEYQVKYKLHFGESFDFGLFTDMAGVREKMKPVLSEAKKVLNLYSYTGAFSLFADAQGAEEVHSVDLSPKYNEWLIENIQENEFDQEKHHIHIGDCIKVCQKLVKEGHQFDLIICDPPTSSSNKKYQGNAFSSYEKLFPLFNQLVKKNGKLVVFLNTHKVYREKFHQRLSSIMYNCMSKKYFRENRRFNLLEDCPTIQGFPEGDYLKGVLFTRNQVDLIDSKNQVNSSDSTASSISDQDNTIVSEEDYSTTEDSQTHEVEAKSETIIETKSSAAEALAENVPKEKKEVKPKPNLNLPSPTAEEEDLKPRKIAPSIFDLPPKEDSHEEEDEDEPNFNIAVDENDDDNIGNRIMVEKYNDVEGNRMPGYHKKRSKFNKKKSFKKRSPKKNNNKYSKKVTNKKNDPS